MYNKKNTNHCITHEFKRTRRTDILIFRYQLFIFHYINEIHSLSFLYACEKILQIKHVLILSNDNYQYFEKCV